MFVFYPQDGSDPYVVSELMFFYMYVCFMIMISEISKGCYWGGNVYHNGRVNGA